MIKLVASDIDGTIIDDNQKVPERNKKAIKSAIAKNIIVMLATGRAPYELFDIACQAGVIADNRYIICCNGAMIMNIKTGQIKDVLKMDFFHASNLFNYAYENHLNFYIYTTRKKYGINTDDDILNNKDNFELIKGDNIDFLKNEDILKAIIKNKNMNYLQALEVDIARITNYDMEISYSSNMYMEINARGINKAIALKKVCAYHGIDMKDILTIGDNYNDVAMLENAGSSVAVRNARLQVKETADYITTADNNNGAVGEAIEKFILNL